MTDHIEVLTLDQLHQIVVDCPDCEANYAELGRVLPEYTGVYYRHRRVTAQEVVDSLSPHQLYSKLWVNSVLHRLEGQDQDLPEPSLDAMAAFMDTLDRWDTSVFGSWLGLGAWFISGYACDNGKLYLIDKDEPSLAFSADFLNACDLDGVTPLLKNMTESSDLPETEYQASIIMNLALEHLSTEEMFKWWTRIMMPNIAVPPQRLVILQATDMRADDHVTYFKDVRELRFSGFQKILYAGELAFSDCKRMMVIGIV